MNDSTAKEQLDLTAEIARLKEEKAAMVKALEHGLETMEFGFPNASQHSAAWWSKKLIGEALAKARGEA